MKMANGNRKQENTENKNNTLNFVFLMSTSKPLLVQNAKFTTFSAVENGFKKFEILHIVLQYMQSDVRCTHSINIGD